MYSKAVLKNFEKMFLFFVLALSLLAVMIASFFLPPSFVLITFSIIFLFMTVLYLVLYLHSGTYGSAKLPKKFCRVSFVIPSYNSKNTIEKCILALKKVEWSGGKEIIVVDDCSTDGSREIVEKISGIRLIKLPKNGGKAIALNTGLQKVSSKFVVCVDSDSYPEKDVLLKTMGYFDEKNVAAVTCLVLPDSKDSFIQKIQYFEYLAGFGLSNVALSSIGGTYIAPGPFTIFRKNVFERVGYYQEDNLAEDLEFGLRLKKHGFRIMSCFDAVVFTDVPKNWRELFIQRDRWYRGSVFNFAKYRGMMFNPKSDFGFFIMPLFFATQVLTIAMLARMLFYFLRDSFFSLSIFAKYIMLGWPFVIDTSRMAISSTSIFFVVAYFFVVIYFWLAFYVVKRRPLVGELPALAILIFIYPYFVVFTYSQSFFKEMIGVRAKWLRVST